MSCVKTSSTKSVQSSKHSKYAVALTYVVKTGGTAWYGVYFTYKFVLDLHSSGNSL